MDQENYKFSAEVAKVLKLMIHSLYKNKDIFLRELISNASDACDKLRFESLTNSSMIAEDAKLRISIILNTKESTITVSDNGIGMSREEMIENLGTVAKSGTAAFAEGIEKSANNDIDLIGQFGVGFYSSFMVADEVEVESRKAGSEEGWVWQSRGEGEFSVKPSVGKPGRGTTIKLKMKESESVYLDKHKLQFIIKTYSDHIGYPIDFTDGEGEDLVVNTASAIWTRPKSELDDEKYAEFYRHIAHSIDKPWMVIHNRNEGVIEYTNLLFIPTLKPFDLFHPDRIRRVKLYVKRVFITDEEIEIIPRYLRFLRGIIDCEDLPLNISRESIQHNAVLNKIRDGVTKRTLSELKKKSEKEPKEYEHFITNFGAILKEGLCEVGIHRQEILEVCRFESALGKGLIGLDEYISNMKEGQEDIYFLTAETSEEARNNPVLAGFIENGYDVLLLTDHVDDFWVNVVHQYKEKKLVSITRSGIELDKPVDKSEKEQLDSELPNVDNVNKLILLLKEYYGDAVKDVTISGKLFDVPAALAVDEGQMDIRFEKFLMEQNQLKSKASKVLEINKDHPVIASMARIAATSNNPPELQDMALMLLDQARIVAGEEIEDRGSFVRRLNNLMQMRLAA